MPVPTNDLFVKPQEDALLFSRFSEEPSLKAACPHCSAEAVSITLIAPITILVVAGRAVEARVDGRMLSATARCDECTKRWLLDVPLP